MDETKKCARRTIKAITVATDSGEISPSYYEGRLYRRGQMVVSVQREVLWDGRLIVNIQDFGGGYLPLEDPNFRLEVK